MVSHHSQERLISWFQKNKRPLPWRKTKDPYKIWISETMLQQTTSTAVIPFYKRFLKKFPNLKSLAQATEEDVYEVWAGLGYYSRARNLLKAAKLLHNRPLFPNTYSELLPLPGFGPYTSRSVSSIAFGENVGVLDGNVIRVLSRHTSKGYQWWKTSERNQLQSLADQWVQKQESSIVNQALMELGATICLPKTPKCLLCPISKTCLGLKNNSHLNLPLKKPKKEKQIWLWQARVLKFKNEIGLIKNDYAPFLKNYLFLPGQAKRLTSPPESFDFKHMITHHEIYVTVKTCKQKVKAKKYTWVNTGDIKKHVPASMIQKAIHLKGE